MIFPSTLLSSIYISVRLFTLNSIVFFKNRGRRLKRTRREADLLHPSSATSKNAWSYTYTSPNVFTARRKDAFSLSCGHGVLSVALQIRRILFHIIGVG